MKPQPKPYAAKIRQFKSLSKRVNHLLESGKFHKLSDDIQTKLINKLKDLYHTLSSYFNKYSLKRILASAAVLLGFQFSSNAQMFAPPVQDTFDLQPKENFRVPTMVDLDGDDDFDMLTGEYYGAFQYYENTGDAQSPSFNAPTTNPFNLDSLNFLNFPTTVDLDNDGDFDILSIEGYYSNMQYYENIGDSEAPKFLDGGTNPFNIESAATSYFYFYLPTTVDLDNDGDFDVVVGGNYGSLAYYENVGSPEIPTFAQPEINPFAIPIDPYSFLTSIDFADFDLDGDYDLVAVKLQYDYIDYDVIFSYYENTGTPETPVFQKAAQSPFSIDTMSGIFSVGLSIADLDDDGDSDIILGGYTYDTVSYTGMGSFFYIENISNPTNTGNAPTVDVGISPNPASDLLNIRIKANSGRMPDLIELVDIQGKSILRQAVASDVVRIELPELPAGNYFVVPRQDGRALGTEKVVIK